MRKGKQRVIAHRIKKAKINFPSHEFRIVGIPENIIYDLTKQRWRSKQGAVRKDYVGPIRFDIDKEQGKKHELNSGSYYLSNNPQPDSHWLNSQLYSLSSSESQKLDGLLSQLIEDSYKSDINHKLRHELKEKYSP